MIFFSFIHFTNPVGLMLLPLIFLPLILNWYKKKSDFQSFPSAFFLEKIISSSQKEKRRWLESFLQSLFLFFLMLLLSGLNIDFSNSSNNQSLNTHQVIVIVDDSHSMIKSLETLPKRYFNNALPNEIQNIDFYLLSSSSFYPSAESYPKSKASLFLNQLKTDSKNFYDWNIDDLQKLLDFVRVVNADKSIYLLSDFKENHLTSKNWEELIQKGGPLKVLKLQQNHLFLAQYTLKKKNYFLDEFLDFSFVVSESSFEDSFITNKEMLNDSSRRDSFFKDKNIQVTLEGETLVNQPLTNSQINVYTRLRDIGKQEIKIIIYDSKTKDLLFEQRDFIAVSPKLYFSVFPNDAVYINFLSRLFYRDRIYKNITFISEDTLANNFNQSTNNLVVFIFDPLNYSNSSFFLTNNILKTKYFIFFNEKQSIPQYNKWLKEKNITDFSFVKEKQIYFDDFIHSTTYTNVQIPIKRESGWSIPYLQLNFKEGTETNYTIFYHHQNSPLVFNANRGFSFFTFDPLINAQITQHPLQILFFYEALFSSLKYDFDLDERDFSILDFYSQEEEYLANSINFQNDGGTNQFVDFNTAHSISYFLFYQLEIFLILLLFVLFAILKFLRL